MRQEPIRSAPHPHTLPTRGEPLEKFGPTASHTTHPGGGMIYFPTGRAPERWEASMIQTHPHDPPPMGEPLEKLGQQPPTPRTRGEDRFILQLVGRPSAGSRQGFPHNRTITPLRGNPWQNLGRSPRTPSPHMGGSLAKFRTQGGGHPN